MSLRLQFFALGVGLSLLLAMGSFILHWTDSDRTDDLHALVAQAVARQWPAADLLSEAEAGRAQTWAEDVLALYEPLAVVELQDAWGVPVARAERVNLPEMEATPLVLPLSGERGQVQGRVRLYWEASPAPWMPWAGEHWAQFWWTLGICGTSVLTCWVLYRLLMQPWRSLGQDLSGPPLKRLPREMQAGFSRLKAWQTRAQRAEDALLRRNEQHDLMLAQSILGIIEWSPDMRVQEWSHAAEEIFGYTAEEIKGRNGVEALVPSEMREAIEEIIAELIRECGGHHSVNENICKDGRRIVCEWFNTVLHDREGRVLGIHSTVADVTHHYEENRRLAQSEARYHHLIRHFPNGAVILFDRDNRILSADGELLHNVKMTREDLLGKRVEEAFPEQVGSQLAPLFTAAWEGWREAMEVQLHGREVRIETLALDYSSGEAPTELMALALDQTERLESLRALNQAKEIVDRASDAKSSFLAQMSHELRTPLNAILGMCEILGWEALTEEQQSHLRIMRTASTHLLGIINEVLDYSQIEGQAIQLQKRRLELTPFLTDLFETACSANPDGVEAKLDLAEDLPREVLFDRQRLGQIILNLLTNAFKFTKEGRVTLRATRHHPPGGGAEVVIAVIDTGIGISEEACERIFEPFQQAEPVVTRTHGGVGLGLAISRRLAEAMGGKLGVESEEGVGSCFHVTLPLAPEDELKLVETDELTPMEILVTEDEPVSRRVMERMLQRLGLGTQGAPDAESALFRLEQETFPLVFMDVQMPGMDGIEATRRIRAQAGEPAPVIIGISAHANQAASELAAAAGMDLYLTKPISFEGVRQAVAQGQRIWQARQRAHV